MGTEIIKLPTLNEIVELSEQEIKGNNLMVLVNQEPPKKWVEAHPFAKIKKDGQYIPLPYLPIERVEFLLTTIFLRWWVEVKSVQLIANSICVTVRLYVINPISKEIEWQDGVGGTVVQTDAGANASDWSKIKANGVMLAAPSAESYAIKDAAEKFGKVFGKDLSRQHQMDYNSLLKQSNDIDYEDLRELFELKRQALSDSELKDALRIIETKEYKSYRKLQTILQNK